MLRRIERGDQLVEILLQQRFAPGEDEAEDSVLVGLARELVHGKSCTVRHDRKGLFRGLPDELEVGRYHSLAATRIPPELEVSAQAADGEVMAVRHRTLPIDGVQFHPESVLTPLGRDIARNFLERR